nr:MAG TPA: hypothetical protein [Caudoviricetes sp.]
MAKARHTIDMIITCGSSSVGRAQPCPKGWTNGQPWQGRCKSRQKAPSTH